MVRIGHSQSSQALPNGVRANEETLKFMSGLCKSRGQMSEVRNIARGIILDAGIESHDFLSEARAIGTFVQSHVHYLRDVTGEELIIDPLTLLDQVFQGNAAGDCDDHALLINTLLTSIGASPYFRAVRYREKFGPYDHVYAVVYERDPKTGKSLRLPLDAIVKSSPMGFELPHLSAQEYSV